MNLYVELDSSLYMDRDKLYADGYFKNGPLDDSALTELNYYFIWHQIHLADITRLVSKTLNVADDEFHSS